MIYTLSEISENSKISIYGAGNVGIRLRNLLKIHRKDVKFLYFLDTYKSGEIYNDNNSFREKINVININDFENIQDKPDFIIIAASAYSEIEQTLKSKNISNYSVIHLSYSILSKLPVDLQKIKKLENPEALDNQNSEINWEKGLDHESEFWMNRLCDGNFTRFRLNPDQEFQDYFKKIVQPASLVSVLDVGAGPFTEVGKKWGNTKIKITPVDPLADDYNNVIDEIGLTPLVRTIKGGFEDVDQMFPENTFDLVNIQNSLDHCVNPIKALKNCFKPLKTGCHLSVFSFINEAQYVGYIGLHQWNLFLEGNKLIIWNPKVKIDVNEHLMDLGEVVYTNIMAEKRWFQIVFKKK
jgi:SAM-dependent methyltransferase